MWLLVENWVRKWVSFLLLFFVKIVKKNVNLATFGNLGNSGTNTGPNSRDTEVSDTPKGKPRVDDFRWFSGFRLLRAV